MVCDRWMFPSGRLNWAWLKALKSSARTPDYTFLDHLSFSNAMSQLLRPGPEKKRRRELPRRRDYIICYITSALIESYQSRYGSLPGSPTAQNLRQNLAIDRKGDGASTAGTEQRSVVSFHRVTGSLSRTL